MKRYSESFKNQVILAISEGMTIYRAARKFSISTSTAWAWKNHGPYESPVCK